MAPDSTLRRTRGEIQDANTTGGGCKNNNDDDDDDVTAAKKTTLKAVRHRRVVQTLRRTGRCRGILATTTSLFLL
eukprot:scaffold1040_cov165-Amphora_coffeaeformis.AAC.6